jgi:hypothetical protein
MTREDAERECARLAAEHPDRATNTWRPREEAGSWSVIRIALTPPQARDLVTETVADERPPTGFDPRPDVPPWVGPAI